MYYMGIVIRMHHRDATAPDGEGLVLHSDGDHDASQTDTARLVYITR